MSKQLDELKYDIVEASRRWVEAQKNHRNHHVRMTTFGEVVSSSVEYLTMREEECRATAEAYRTGRDLIVLVERFEEAINVPEAT